MPWTPADAQKHDKSANTPEKAKRWSKIANAVLKRTGDDAMAIRVANSRVESLDHALSESFLKRVMDYTFQTPEEFRKPQRPAPKKAQKPKSAEGKPAVREPLLARVKRAATRTSKAIFPEDILVREPLVIEAEEEKKGEKKPFGAEFAARVEKAGRAVEKAVDITNPKHKLHGIYKWAEKHAGTYKPASKTQVSTYDPSKMGAGKAASSASGSAERAFVRTRFGTPMQQATRYRQSQGPVSDASAPLPVRRPPGRSR